MTISKEQLRRIARDFWGGSNRIFPADLERLTSLALPVALVKMPLLSTDSVATWLRAHSIEPIQMQRSFALRGCLFAHRGKGLIFLKGSDPHEEQRFTLAHEIAHFILNYIEPRQKIINRLGLSICEVLDGDRSPSIAERCNALLNHVQIGPHFHLLTDAKSSTIDSLTYLAAEEDADELAREIAAPHTEINQSLSALAGLADDEAMTQLSIIFGLPSHVFGAVVKARHKVKRSSIVDFAIFEKRRRNVQ